jgi:hypothetical protein
MVCERYGEPEYQSQLPTLLEAGINFNFLEKMMELTGLMHMLIQHCHVKKIISLNLAYDLGMYMKGIGEGNIDVAG